MFKNTSITIFNTFKLIYNKNLIVAGMSKYTYTLNTNFSTSLVVWVDPYQLENGIDGKQIIKKHCVLKGSIP